MPEHSFQDAARAAANGYAIGTIPPKRSTRADTTTAIARSASTSAARYAERRIMPTTSSGLQYDDLLVGQGAVAQAGQYVSVHYTGWLTNGRKFDSSLDRGDPFSFHLGQGQVIAGWDEGVQGMQIGGKRKLTIPSDLGYGPYGAGGVIPPDATLVFEVELLGVQ
jgi:FKBP-type peptidyl-prolyl cis-trans isomerase